VIGPIVEPWVGIVCGPPLSIGAKGLFRKTLEIECLASQTPASTPVVTVRDALLDDILERIFAVLQVLCVVCPRHGVMDALLRVSMFVT
jgi:hypothetical protein